MSNKVVFTCRNCGAEGTIKLDDDHQIECCPSCCASLDLDDDFDEDEE